MRQVGVTSRRLCFKLPGYGSPGASDNPRTQPARYRLSRMTGSSLLYKWEPCNGRQSLPTHHLGQVEKWVGDKDEGLGGVVPRGYRV